ncbi:MAG: MurR/RpiR family transcriptional regulator [Rhizobiaceae bacterium]|nr:MurR/RpiR family transcriptional regulator [Rhizobiaceae bacterium]
MSAAAKPSLDALRHKLSGLRKTAAPEVARLAGWVLARPHEVAFHSVRGLAEKASVNANTVVRLSQALGFDGFEACRLSFQDALRQRSDLYSSRAAQLQTKASGDLYSDLRDAAHANIDALFDDDSLRKIGLAAELLLRARRIHCVGVRSCFSLARYLAYTGAMAFPAFAQRVSEPGDIYDLLSETGPDDVVVAITFPLYSVETVLAASIAKSQGAKTIAITDGFNSPVAEGAEIVLVPPMLGPQTLPSLIAAFATAEILIATMVSRSDQAPARIASYERRLHNSGAYVR